MNSGTFARNRYVLETTFVLFFLSVVLGQELLSGSFDTVFLGITVVAVAVLPFFLPSETDSEFSAWLAGRSAILTLGLVSGVAFNQIVGVIVPEVFGHLPLALATVAGIASCYLMYANLLRFHYAD